MATHASHADSDLLDKLQLPSAKALTTLSYFGAETWPKISQIITTDLSTKNVISSVAPMVESNEVEFYNPWIVVRIIPTSKNKSIPTDNDIKEVLIKNGYFDPQYKILIENGKRAAKPTLNGGKTSHWKRGDKSRYTAESSSTTTTSVPTNSTTNTTTSSSEATEGAADESTSRTTPRSVKHLTCWYWFNNHGGCSKTESECLYSHTDTGRYAEQPRSLVPGGRAVAGRNAERIEADIRSTFVTQPVASYGTVLPNAGYLGLASGVLPPNAEPYLASYDSPAIETVPFNHQLPTDLAYSPPGDDDVLKTATLRSMVPSTVERRALPTFSERVAAMSPGQDPAKKPINDDGIPVSMKTYSQGYINPVHPHASISSPGHPLQTAARREYNGFRPSRMFETARDFAPQDNYSKRKADPGPIKPPTTSRHRVRSSSGRGGFRFKPKFNEFKSKIEDTPHSSDTDPATLLSQNHQPGKKSSLMAVDVDRMSLLYSNMHSVMAARELCIGLDNDITGLESLQTNMSSLGLGIDNLEEAPQDKTALTQLRTQLENLTTHVNTVAEKAKTQRKRAESIMKTEENAKHVFGWKTEGRTGVAHDESDDGGVEIIV